MKKTKVGFWISTILIFLFEGVMPALTFNSDLAKEGISHLGYPLYFGYALVVCKVLGALTLIIPQMPKQLKEWAYAGFTFNFIFASVSHLVVDGPGVSAVFPLIVLAVLAVSYFSYHKLNMVPKN